MKALDTNVLVRFLVADDARQSAAAKRLLESAEKSGERFLVTQLVLLELFWVLDSVYGYSRNDILTALESLLQMPVLEVESLDRVHALITQGRAGTVGLADLWIGLSAREKDCEATLTFDRKAARSGLFEKII